MTRPLLRLARWAKRPLEQFLLIEAASGIVLLIAAGVALVWANSRWADDYVALWHTAVGVRLGSFSFERPLEWVVNDGLMVIFFFVVGLEIKRELHHGELSTWRRATLPFAAAVGGMAAPALLYLALAGGAATRHGWGVPMATDIAFAVGVLMLLGPRVPAAMRVLLLALAVIDDLGAIVVIALFYSSGLVLAGLGVAVLGVAGVFVLRALGVRRPLIYALPALVAWGGTYAAGIHPTIAGVIIGLCTPVAPWLDPDGHEVESPAEDLIDAMHPWVSFVIMPIFALANAGVALDGLHLDGTSSVVAIAVAVGLVIGKPLGVLAACALVLKLGVATLPRGLGIRHLIVLGVVAGIGFTMALFVAQLAFTEPALLGAAKLGILGASAVAIALGLVAGRLLLPRDHGPGVAATADEAEASTEQ